MPVDKTELTGYEYYNLSSYCDTHKIYDEIMKCFNENLIHLRQEESIKMPCRAMDIYWKCIWRVKLFFKKIMNSNLFLLFSDILEEVLILSNFAEQKILR